MVQFWNSIAGTRRRVGEQYRHSSTVLSFNHDGLEIARVRNERRWLPFWHIAVFLYLAMLIRLVTIADIGPAAYANRMEVMNNGTFLERTAARVMQMDPVSQSIANQLRSTLRDLGAI